MAEDVSVKKNTLMCPFITTVVSLDTDDGSISTEVMTECLQENCGAWRKGHCCRVQ